MRVPLETVVTKVLPVGLAVALLAGVARGADSEARDTPIVDQLLVHRSELHLSAAQVERLRAISERRTHTLDVLEARLRASDAQSSAAAAQDSLALMQEMGRLRVLSGADALRVLDTAQRRHWTKLHARTAGAFPAATPSP